MAVRPLRNVLLIVADQWRGDCLSALGHPCARTPNLDALASEGTLFRRHYGQASPCGPARASLLTGMYLQNHRSVANGTPLDARHTNLALEARRFGHAPALFGYTDTSPDPRGRDPGDPALRSYEGVMAGFDPVCSLTESIEPWAEHLRARGYLVPEPARAIYRAAEPFGPAAYRAEDSDTAFLADRLIGWLKGGEGKPWFALAAFIRPHPPWVAPAPYHDLIDPATTPPAARAVDWTAEGKQHPWLAWHLARQKTDCWMEGEAVDPRVLDAATLARLRATYHGLIAELDTQIGRIIDHLRQTGALDDTLVIVTSDHGEMLGEHWMLGKSGYFDEAYHVPLIIRDPDRLGGGVIDAFTEHVDLMPTILDWLDGTSPTHPPAQCDGRSLAPLLSGAVPADWRSHAHWEFDFRDVIGGETERALGLRPGQCVLNVLRGERYKYVHFAALPPLFFDLAEDPGQFRDLAADPAHAALVRDHAQALLSWRMENDERVLANTLLTADGVFSRGETRGPDMPKGAESPL
ncbi:phosphonate monoester hydrolase [Skermanella stibiiresistens SB22]|uniref:Phosphonate monoester hydrolase n=1 Tax=Skermanella stibiiresistens SB22 TaxID=1385369 RepID=W9HFI8_9PROT|nr:alkaline phosphatase family protein [Skermanella stibiiresistens]EWY42633.1 phosphonate monoester hydrolase [Skermanella stibiiresistens SB22]